MICLRDVQVDRKVPGGSGAGGNKRPTYSQPQPSNEPKFERGTHVKTSEIQQNNEEKFTRNTVDPKYKEIKSKENLWTEAKIKEKKQDPKKLLENNIRAFLNILTPDNFDVIKDGILDLARPSHENIDLLVQKVIEKAWVEPKYIETYAKLCFFLQNEKSLTFPDQEKKSTEPGSKKKSTNPFKSKLLEKIQKAFETEEVTDQKQKGLYKKVFKNY